MKWDAPAGAPGNPGRPLDNPIDDPGAPVARPIAIAWTLVALLAAALLQYAFYSKGGHETLADVPGRFIFWRLGWHSFPYLDRGVEYPVVVGYLSWILASLTGSAARFFLAN